MAITGAETEARDTILNTMKNNIECGYRIRDLLVKEFGGVPDSPTPNIKKEPSTILEELKDKGDSLNHTLHTIEDIIRERILNVLK